MKVEIRASAQDDLRDAADFYDEQAAGLGDEVLVFLYSVIAQLSLTGGNHRKVRHFHRMVVLGRFPYYVVYYQMQGDTVIVNSVLDHRRDPKWIRRTLRDRS